ncbi:MAG: hypothetical protein ACFBSG_12675 [Leptolyngbyaceae cyanobacterium]
MVSFRNDQFQAVLTGMVLADAISHGQLPWTLVATASPLAELDQPPFPLSALAVTADHWCHTIAAQLSTRAGNMALSAWASYLTEDVLLTLLSQLPQHLLNLDQMHAFPGTASDMAQPPAIAEAIEVRWQRCLLAAMHHDRTQLEQISLALAAVGRDWTAAEQGLLTAIDHVTLAHGDFQLALGQSLQAQTAPIGTPIVTGILSAAWGGMASLPGAYQQSLIAPEPALCAWLQERWHLTDRCTLQHWSQGLWLRWLGAEASGGAPQLILTVQPRPL